MKHLLFLAALTGSALVYLSFQDWNEDESVRVISTSSDRHGDIGLYAARVADRTPPNHVTTTTTAAKPIQSTPPWDGWTWDELAECEDNDDPSKGPTGWQSNTGNGFEGGLQFMNATWLGYGGGEFAQHAYDATREQQIVIAERVLAAEGPGAWPTCSYRVGMR